MTTTARLPGIVVRTEAPPPADALPRMDVAAFVGLATGGPFHVPVPVEDAARFREIFGDDVELPWDPERGETARSFLGAAVDAFFRTGGRRCWVVRAGAGEPGVTTFALPGVVTVNDGGPSLATGEEARADARSGGSWADALAVRTRLERTRLRLRLDDGALPVVVTDGAWTVDVAATPVALATGDLVELSADDGALRAYLFVDRLESIHGGRRLHASPAYWYALADADSAPEPLSAAEGEAAFAAWVDSATDPAARLAVRRLSLELLVLAGDELTHRLADLALDGRHPRCWARLPDDATLFGTREGRPVARRPEALQALWEEASDPRFPLAGPGFTDSELANLRCLPLGVPEHVVLASAGGATADTDGSSPLARDGVATYSADPFLDPDLAGSGSLSLLGEAEHKRDIRGEALSGLHAVLPLAEVSMLAVPDAVHRPWGSALPSPEPRLAAPDLAPLPDLDERGVLRIVWTEVAEATGYLLEGAPEGASAAPTIRLRTDQARADLAWSDSCARPVSFRVRALRHGEASAWSRTRRRWLPRSDFLACARPPLPDLRLDLEDDPGGDRLAWTPLAGAAPTAVDAYELEFAGDVDFADVTTRVVTTDTDRPAPAPLDAPLHARVRALAGDRTGPWSNTVRIEPAARSESALVPPAEYADTDLLAIHSALLRFCAARADLVAVLALPRHYRRDETLGHLADLGAGVDLEPAGGAALFHGSGTVTVPALSPGERDVLAWGALYHPWLAVRDRAVEAPRAAVRFAPPDGAAAGSMALRALGRGAWHAPANEPLPGVVALDPDLDRGVWASLAAVQVNLVRRESRGIVILGADTLSRERARRPLSVRRLLILLRRLALRVGRADVFEPNSADFRRFTQHRFERVLGDLYVRGALRGASAGEAYRVVTDASLNPPESIEQGRFVVELQIAPSEPLAFLTVRLIRSGQGAPRIQEI